jgi:hypothetical protein
MLPRRSKQVDEREPAVPWEKPPLHRVFEQIAPRRTGIADLNEPHQRSWYQ